MGTIRFRLTLWYAALFLAAGIALLALVYVLVDRAFPEADPTFIERVASRPGVSDSRDALENLGVLPPRRGVGQPRPDPIENRVEAILDFVEQGRIEAREEALDTLLVQSSLALAAMAVLSVAAGWWIAGRMLRPVADITGTVRRISGERLSDHRVALEGPRDELKELADQFDAMLDRLDAAFRAQREFVANASHELRTPLAVMRAELDVTFDNPDATPEEMRESADVLRRAIGRSEALIAALLTLERADAPRQRSERVDLSERARSVLDQHAERARVAGIEVRSMFDPAETLGDPVLLERLIENLVSNAIAYNQAPDGRPGWIEVAVRRDGDECAIRVANAASDVDALTVDTLFERFRRLDNSRSRETGGHGLGLAIVRAVARHHGGEASAQPVAGGLAFEVRLPAAPVASAPPTAPAAPAAPAAPDVP
ncbi:MAG: sensor histidine kinase [Dehalococcoidia bacterium]